MLELAADLLPRLRAGEPVAVVTVSGVARSAPRGVGASMAVTADGAVIGSISGGCVEGEAVVLALAVLAGGSARRARFGFSDEQAHAAGLACGGTVDVVAYRVAPDDGAAVAALEAAESDRPVTVAIPLAGPLQGRVLRPGTEAARAIDEALAAAALLGESRVFTGPDGGVLAISRSTRARLIIIGAGDHAAALSRVGTAAGFAVTVCDPWALLLTPERFPGVTLVEGDPVAYLARLADDPAGTDSRTAVCVLTHDERLDVPSIHAALGMDVGFVGAMGARATVARRAALLRARGVSAEELGRLHSPLGLDLGGRSPEETAVSVVAEIVAARFGGTGVPLRETRGPVHTDVEAPSDDPSDIPSRRTDANTAGESCRH